MVVSQIWVQHLHCMQIIGHCYLRGGSELEPELGGLLYTALVVTLAEIEQEFQYKMSGVYGYRIPEIEGIGLFTIQNDYFRIERRKNYSGESSNFNSYAYVVFADGFGNYHHKCLFDSSDSRPDFRFSENHQKYGGRAACEKNISA